MSDAFAGFCIALIIGCIALIIGCIAIVVTSAPSKDPRDGREWDCGGPKIVVREINPTGFDRAVEGRTCTDRRAAR